jgi:hypothetical protein
METSDNGWIRQLLKGFVSAFMLCEAIALYEAFVKYGVPELQFVPPDSPPSQFSPAMWIFPTAFTIMIELIAYFKVLKPIGREKLEKQTATKSWVNVLFFLSLIFGGLVTAGGIVGMALLAVVVVVLEK